MNDAEAITAWDALLRKRNQAQLNWLRQSNAMLRVLNRALLPQHETPANMVRGSEADRIFSVFNGHPVKFMDIVAITGISQNNVACNISRLIKRGHLRRVRFGVYERASAYHQQITQ